MADRKNRVFIISVLVLILLIEGVAFASKFETEFTRSCRSTGSCSCDSCLACCGDHGDCVDNDCNYSCRNAPNTVLEATCKPECDNNCFCWAGSCTTYKGHSERSDCKIDSGECRYDCKGEYKYCNDGFFGCEQCCNHDECNEPGSAFTNYPSNVYYCTSSNPSECRAADCSMTRNDGHCDRDTTDGDGYFCYYDTDKDCVESNAGVADSGVPAGATNKSLCNGEGDSGYVANPLTHECVIPNCMNSDDCTLYKQVCQNPGEWNAFCARDLEGKGSFLAETVQSITEGGEKYYFLIYEKYMINTDIYHDNDGSYDAGEDLDEFTLVSGGLNNGDYFTLNGKTYRIFFTVGASTEDFSLNIYEVSFYQRLTYNIFPVCGNGVCEYCDPDGKCLHYPPESCMSCPVDCPAISDSQLQSFNTAYHKMITYGDILNNNDLSCQVRNNDTNSLCNPLCVTHDFIDVFGCVYNRYTTAQPVYAHNSSIVVDYYHNRTADKISFEGDLLTVLKSDKGGFYGKAPEDSYVEDPELGYDYSNTINFLETSSGNSECLSNCECESGYCSKENPNTVDVTGDEDEEYGHCCPRGFEWSSVSAADEFCDGNGSVLPSVKDVFKDSNDDTYIDVTQNITLVGNNYKFKDEGKKVTDVYCVDGEDNKPSCKYGLDPLCSYKTMNGEYYPIKPTGVYQCRPTEADTESVVLDIRCTVHSHAWAQSDCQQWVTDLHWTCADGGLGLTDYSTYYDWMCITDNPDECFSKRDVRTTAGSTGVLLRSISYEEFCTTKSLVCEDEDELDSNDKLKSGGKIDFTNCAQDGFADQYEASITEFMKGDAFPQVDYETMSVGYYCSLFGNDFERIMNINAGNKYKIDKNKGTESIDMSQYSEIMMWALNEKGQSLYNSNEVYEGDKIRQRHLPRIDRDASERLYHYLFNYETCKAMFGDRVPDCQGVNSDAVKDDEGRPTHPYLGTYKQPKPSSEVKSRAYCKKFWKAYEEAGYSGLEFDFDWSWSKMDYSGADVAYLPGDIGEETFPLVRNDYNSWDFSIENLDSTDEITVDGNTLNKDDMKRIIKGSCLYWYEPFLDNYYNTNGDVSADDLGIPVDPPYYKAYYYKYWAGYFTKYDPHFSWVMKKFGDCSEQTGLRIFEED